MLLITRVCAVVITPFVPSVLETTTLVSMEGLLVETKGLVSILTHTRGVVADDVALQVTQTFAHPFSTPPNSTLPGPSSTYSAVPTGPCSAP